MSPEHSGDTPPYPSYYVDFFNPEVNDVTLTIIFGKRKAPDPSPAPPTGPTGEVPTAIAATFPDQSRPQIYQKTPGLIIKPSHAIHMNPLYAKAMALVLLKMVSAMEQFHKFKYPLPPHLAQMFDISEKDWG
ncbi:MAG: hypothetical protein Q8O76_07765 [Chloroflexota bacterium]|nr:hypothetical protein [Chloroflexota bacterium]